MARLEYRGGEFSGALMVTATLRVFSAGSKECVDFFEKGFHFRAPLISAVLRRRNMSRRGIIHLGMGRSPTPSSLSSMIQALVATIHACILRLNILG